ncbi:sugar ABC transporter substrate-binding protein [Pseudonocardia sp. NPDC049635]|uniref:sugar ABC transporter substrate-binding protein n=1 Tax=Pseudonocardia sp. NPDC049635 TaxID=3155506 RepID=UPI0033C8A6D2
MALTGCSTGSATPAGADPASGVAGFEPGTKFGFAAPVAAQPGQQQFDAGAQAAAASVGWDYTMYDSNLNPSTQISNITTMIQQQMDVIGSWTLDPGATVGIYKQAEAAGIPVIGVNSEGEGIQATLWQESSTCAPGGPMEQSAALYAEAHPGGQIITVGLDGVPSIDSVVKCFTDAATAAGLTVVSHVSNTTDQAAGAQRLVADLLTRFPEVDGVWAYNDASALGASAAVMAAGKTVYDMSNDGVVVTGTNGDADAVTAVREGRLTGTWDPNNPQAGWLFVWLANEVLKGTAPASTVLKSTFVTKESVDEYVPPADRQITFDALDYTTSN